MAESNEARGSRIFFVGFTLAMIVGVPSNLIWHGAPNYEGAFYRAIFLSISLSLLSLLLRIRADFGNERTRSE